MMLPHVTHRICQEQHLMCLLVLAVQGMAAAVLKPMQQRRPIKHKVSLVDPLEEMAKDAAVVNQQQTPGRGQNQD